MREEPTATIRELREQLATMALTMKYEYQMIGKALAWLDSQDFYEICQRYRHAQDAVPRGPGQPTAVEAFEDLKSAIRQQIGVSS